ncbi:hypothetical protein DL768_011441 [Monosporascus sp. mg162]|nr:hypothetical protein DL768_011441 [Monosporascus sp. mg162]
MRLRLASWTRGSTAGTFLPDLPAIDTYSCFVPASPAACPLLSPAFKLRGLRTATVPDHHSPRIPRMTRRRSSEWTCAVLRAAPLPIPGPTVTTSPRPRRRKHAGDPVPPKMSASVSDSPNITSFMVGVLGSVTGVSRTCDTRGTSAVDSSCRSRSGRLRISSGRERGGSSTEIGSST